MQIWPAIDIRAGKCVRLSQGDYELETIYGANPADMAHRFVAEGATFLHVIDLDGARDGSQSNLRSIAKIVKEVPVTLQVGGGIRTEESIDRYLQMGVQRLILGTKAVTDIAWFEAMAQKYPSQLAVGIDARDDKVAIDGWRKTSEITAFRLAQQISLLPVAAIIFTDISKDGMLSGPNFIAMERMHQAVDVPVICSGGVTTVEDIVRLKQLGLTGCIVGRALYEGRLTLAEALAAANRPEQTNAEAT